LPRQKHQEHARDKPGSDEKDNDEDNDQKDNDDILARILQVQTKKTMMKDMSKYIADLQVLSLSFWSAHSLLLAHSQVLSHSFTFERARSRLLASSPSYIPGPNALHARLHEERGVGVHVCVPTR
jgi:hypothetical protein